MIYVFDDENSMLIPNINIIAAVSGGGSVRGTSSSGTYSVPLTSSEPKGKLALRIKHPAYEEFQRSYDPDQSAFKLVTMTRIAQKTTLKPVSIPTAPTPATAKIPAVVASQQNKGKIKLSGMIRMSNNNRIAIGLASSVSVNLMYSGGQNLNSSAKATVVIKDPKGTVVANQTYSQLLNLNTYKEKKFDLKPLLAGKNSVTVSADGEAKTHWGGTFTFTVNANQ